MATYIPNVNPWLPDVKTFTPDYKFLSDALTQRQSKYNTNYKQLNNAYSRIVYTDLSREDTNEARTQFINNLQPEIEKISGLDLSLAQNVRAADGVFQPFYDNNLIIKDMVMTEDYKNKVGYAQKLAQSSKEEDNEKYWDEGLEILKYKMDDFINASQEDALNSYLPSYTQNPQLYKRAMAYLKAQDYNVKFDRISEDGNFIITDVNGKNITATAMADLKMKFLSNDVLKKAYYTKSYVDSRKFAEKQMKEKLVSSISEGILKYNTGTVQAHHQATAARIVQYGEQIIKIEDELSKLEKDMKGRTPKPGSAIAQKMQILENGLEGKKMEREMAINSASKAAQLLKDNNPKAINDRGYNMQMQSNIMGDLSMAAQRFSMINAERTLKVNEVKMQDRKEQHDARMERMKFVNKRYHEEFMTGELEKRKENELRLEKKYGVTKGKTGSGDDKGTANWVNDLFKEVLGIDQGVSGQTEDIVEIDELRDDVELNYFADKQEDLIQSEISTFINLNTSDKNLVKLPVNVNLEGLSDEDQKLILGKDGSPTDGLNQDRYVKPELFRKIMNLEGNYAPFQDELNSIINSDNITPKSEFMRQSLIGLRNEQKMLKAQKEKYLGNVKDNLDIAMRLNELNMPSIYQKDEKGIVRRVSKDAYLNMHLEVMKEQDSLPWESIRYGTGLPIGTEAVLKDKKDPIWQDLKNGRIKKFITRLDKNGKEKKILNPHLFEIKEFYKSDLNAARHAQWRFRSSNKTIQDNMNKRIAETIQFVKDANFQGMTNAITPSEILNQIPVINITTEKRILDDQYDGLALLSDDISKGAGEYADPNAQKAFNYYSPIAESLGIQDYESKVSDLIVGRAMKWGLGNKDVENKNEEIALQVGHLQHALSLDGVQVVGKAGATSRWKEETVIPNDGILHIIKRWTDGKLSMGTNTHEFNYSLQYVPAIADQTESKYILTKSRVKIDAEKNTPSKMVEEYVVKVPISKDINKLSVKNDNTNFTIDNILDPKTDSNKRNFGDGGNIFVTKNNGVYNIEANFSMYDVYSDNMIEVLRSQLPTSLSNIDVTTADPFVAENSYKEYVKVMTGWAVNNLSKRERFQMAFTEYLKAKYESKEKIKGLTDDVLNDDWKKFVNQYIKK